MTSPAELRRAGAPWVLIAGWSGRGDAEVPADTAHHLRRVRRLRDGDRVVVTDGAGRVAAGRLDRDLVRVEAVRVEPVLAPRLRIVQGIGSRGKHDNVVRMLTEVGVDEIVGVTCVRSQVRPDHKAARVLERWVAVADSAVSQARRSTRPVVAGPMALDEAVASCAPDDRIVVADPTATISPIVALADVTAATAVVHLVVGPEGGLADDELARLDARGGTRVSLGRSVLRTEHAALALAAVASAALGRMGDRRARGPDHDGV